jgi:hypothetical protein
MTSGSSYMGPSMLSLIFLLSLAFLWGQ